MVVRVPWIDFYEKELVSCSVILEFNLGKSCISTSLQKFQRRRNNGGYISKFNYRPSSEKGGTLPQFPRGEIGKQLSILAYITTKDYNVTVYPPYELLRKDLSRD